MIDQGQADLPQLLKVFIGACRGVDAFHSLPTPYAVRDIKVGPWTVAVAVPVPAHTPCR